MNGESKRNDKLFEIILEEAAQRYADDIAEEDFEMSDEAKAAMEAGKQRVYKNIMKQIREEERPHRRIRYKKFIIIAAAISLILAASMSASAFRSFMYRTYLEMKGTVLSVTSKSVTDEDYDVITEYEYPDELIVPDWLPPELRLTSINDTEKYISFLYENETGEKFVRFSQENVDVMSDGGLETENNVVVVEDYSVLGMPAKLIYWRSEIGIENYMAHWCSDDTEYCLDTNYSRSDMLNILNKLKYLK